MPRPKGLPKTGGRKKGVQNKITGDLRAMIAGALDAAGGQEYLTRQARLNPQAFLALVGKTLPRDITLTGGLQLEVNLVSRRQAEN